MKRSLTVIFLFLAGLILLVIGGSILFTPQVFYAGDGILLGRDPSLLSEIRAPGGLLTGSALVILTGLFLPQLRSLALMLAVLVYGSFGLSRLVGLALDGAPSQNLVIATGVELTVATMGLLLAYQQSREDLTKAH